MYFSWMSGMLSFLILFALEHKAVIGKGFFSHPESKFMACSLPLLPTGPPCRRKQQDSCTEWLKRSQDDLGFPAVLKEYFTLWLALISKPSLQCVHIVYLTLACDTPYLESAQRKQPAERKAISASLRAPVTTKCGFLAPGNAEMVQLKWFIYTDTCI